MAGVVRKLLAAGKALSSNHGNWAGYVSGAMKPRLKCFACGLWLCFTDLGHIGMGLTPQAAYDCWFVRNGKR